MRELYFVSGLSLGLDVHNVSSFLSLSCRSKLSNQLSGLERSSPVLREIS